jgi:hypothetical protein
MLIWVIRLALLFFLKFGQNLLIYSLSLFVACVNLPKKRSTDRTWRWIESWTVRLYHGET